MKKSFTAILAAAGLATAVAAYLKTEKATEELDEEKNVYLDDFQNRFNEKMRSLESEIEAFKKENAKFGKMKDHFRTQTDVMKDDLKEMISTKFEKQNEKIEELVSKKEEEKNFFQADPFISPEAKTPDQKMRDIFEPEPYFGASRKKEPPKETSLFESLDNDFFKNDFYKEKEPEIEEEKPPIPERQEEEPILEKLEEEHFEETQPFEEIPATEELAAEESVIEETVKEAALEEEILPKDSDEANSSTKDLDEDNKENVDEPEEKSKETLEEDVTEKPEEEKPPQENEKPMSFLEKLSSKVKHKNAEEKMAEPTPDLEETDVKLDAEISENVSETTEETLAEPEENVEKTEAVPPEEVDAEPSSEEETTEPEEESNEPEEKPKEKGIIKVFAYAPKGELEDSEYVYTLIFEDLSDRTVEYTKVDKEGNEEKGTLNIMDNMMNFSLSTNDTIVVNDLPVKAKFRIKQLPSEDYKTKTVCLTSKLMDTAIRKTKITMEGEDDQDIIISYLNKAGKLTNSNETAMSTVADDATMIVHLFINHVEDIPALENGSAKKRFGSMFSKK